MRSCIAVRRDEKTLWVGYERGGGACELVVVEEAVKAHNDSGCSGSVGRERLGNRVDYAVLICGAAEDARVADGMQFIENALLADYVYLRRVVRVWGRVRGLQPG